MATGSQAVASQVNIKINTQSNQPSQVWMEDSIFYARCGGFLERPFLTDPFLIYPLVCAGSRSQYDSIINGLSGSHSQYNATINATAVVPSQYLGKINATAVVPNQYFGTIISINPVPSQYLARISRAITQPSQYLARINVEKVMPGQFQSVATSASHSQVTVVLYNIVRPRILVDFVSRGAGVEGGGNNAWGFPKGTGQNWQASSTEIGDYSILNVNNDVEEFVWKSAPGDVSGVVLKNDSEIPQGVFVDTIYVGNHNLTTSAIFRFQGSDDPLFATTPLSEDLEVRAGRIYWVAPVLPLVSYKYYRIVIIDPSNPAGQLQIGTIVFGSAVIMITECPTQDVDIDWTEFKESVRTEGFTSVGNSRSLKKAMKWDWRYIRYEAGDYQRLFDVIQYVRTTLKAVWFLDPRNTDMQHRFSAFGKLRKVPSERHRVIGPDDYEDHISFPIEIDEAE